MQSLRNWIWYLHFFFVSNSIKKEAKAVLSSNRFVWFISYWISRQTAPWWQNIHHITAHIFSRDCQIFTHTQFGSQNFSSSELDLIKICRLILKTGTGHVWSLLLMFWRLFAFKRPLNMLQIQWQQWEVFCNRGEACSDALKVWTVKGCQVWTMWWVWSFY